MSAESIPMFQIQSVYLKEITLEQPNHSRALLREGHKPSLNIQIGVTADSLEEGIFEVCVTCYLHAQIQDKTLYCLEAKQVGSFEIRNLPVEQMEPILGMACPQIVYPYLRGNVADLLQRGGFEPVHLAEINFQNLHGQALEDTDLS